MVAGEEHGLNTSCHVAQKQKLLLNGDQGRSATARHYGHVDWSKSAEAAEESEEAEEDI